jgi:hypothetical protein
MDGAVTELRLMKSSEVFHRLPSFLTQTRRRFLIALISLTLFLPICPARAAYPEPSTVASSTLDNEIKDFLGKEMLAHLDQIKSYDPPPGKIFSAETTGEYTWGNFMYALGTYARLSGKAMLGDHDLAHEIGEAGLLEYRLKGTRFSQLYGVLALQFFGRDLSSNPVWQDLSEADRERWRKFLDISAFYDPKTQQVINLPENYLGVAARIASISYQLGLVKDRALVDGVITRAARPFANGGIFSDDAPPTGRFDRYSNEYARFVWEAAETAGRKDILEALKPTLKEQMRLWWDMVQPDGYGYAWGRSVGLISYADTLEIVGFLAQHSELRPAPLDQLASAYYQAWRWLRHDYNETKHGFSVFDFGRGNFSYITRAREWQQTISILAKAALAERRFMDGLTREKIAAFPIKIARPDVSRFVFFRHGDRPAGVWLARHGSIYFALPITTGTKPGVADYLPAPHGLPGFANPVEQVYPSLVPFIELADGRVFVASDGADEIYSAQDGKTLRAIWRRWAAIGSKPGEFFDINITAEVTWRLVGNSLIRDETLMATKEVELSRWWVAIPTIASTAEVEFRSGRRWDRMKFGESKLSIAVAADWPLVISLKANGDDALGRGARGPVPLHLIYESSALRLTPSKRAHWRLILRVE